MPAFPHHLCTILHAGGERAAPVVLRSEVERGIPRQRRAAADALVQVSLQLGFETAQASADFDAWFYGEALAGAAWFDFINPRTNTVVQARVVGGDFGSLTPLAEAYRVAERSIELEYVRPGFRTLPPGLHSVTPAQVLQVQRASTATFVDASGVLQTAAAHVARFTYFSGKNIYSGPVDLVAGPGVYGAWHLLKTSTNNPASLRPGETITVSAQIYQDAASLADGPERVAQLYLWFQNAAAVWSGAVAVGSAAIAPSGRLSASITLPALASDMDGVGVGVYHIGGSGARLGTVRADAVMVERGAVATAYEPGARLLVEPAATNLATSSQNLVGTGWGGSNAVALAAELYRGFAPFWTITKTTSFGSEFEECRIGQVPAGSVITGTVALLAGSTNVAGVGLYDFTANDWGSVSDIELLEGPGVLTTLVGSLFEVSGLSPTVPTVVRTTRTYSAAPNQCAMTLYSGGPSSTTIGHSIKATRVQVETGAAATSYIPTTTVPATRAADVIQVTA